VGDRDRLIQVLINLISNAIKFTDEGSITCRTHLQNGHVLVSVIDTGIGINASDQPKVFEKFKQVGDTLTDKPKGTGLGLPICKQIIEHHGGVIWVDSEPGKGSTFSFTLPLNQTSSHTERVNLDRLVRHLKQHVVTTASAPNRSHKTILVVDDDAHIRELLRQELEAEGYEVKQAVDGMDAIAQVKETKPDLIILDVMMPQINGFDVAAVFKNNPQTMDIPIIILSIIEDKERGYHLGVDRYLTKPINRDALLRDIGALLSQGSSNKKVLVVDRNASTVRVLSDILQSQGFSVMEASSSQECIEKALSTRPDMIIVDSHFSQQHNLVKTLRFEKGMENLLFILLAEAEEQEEGGMEDKG
jgi:CheY-like chemotaxis protein